MLSSNGSRLRRACSPLQKERSVREYQQKSHSGGIWFILPVRVFLVFIEMHEVTVPFYACFCVVLIPPYSNQFFPIPSCFALSRHMLPRKGLVDFSCILLAAFPAVFLPAFSNGPDRLTATVVGTWKIPFEGSRHYRLLPAFGRSPSNSKPRRPFSRIHFFSRPFS